MQGRNTQQRKHNRFVGTLFSDSLLSAPRETFIPSLFGIRRFVIAALVQSGSHDNKNNRTLILRIGGLGQRDLICLHVSDLYKVQRVHIWNLSFQNFSICRGGLEQRESLTLVNSFRSSKQDERKRSRSDDHRYASGRDDEPGGSRCPQSETHSQRISCRRSSIPQTTPMQIAFEAPPVGIRYRA